MSDFDQKALSAACGRPVRFYEMTDSTNGQAHVLGLEGAPSGTLVVADSQFGGKGRLGRSWSSPGGLNLYFSLVLRPALPPESAPLCCLATAVALAEVLDLRIKWPNDVLTPDGAKVAGILAELHATAGALEFLVLGVGVNVNQAEFSPELPNPASLIQLRGHALDRSALCGELVRAIERRCAQLETAPGAVLDAWRARSSTLGAQVRVGDVEGRAVALREDGALVLETPAGPHVVLTGDVEMVSG